MGKRGLRTRQALVVLITLLVAGPLTLTQGQPAMPFDRAALKQQLKRAVTQPSGAESLPAQLESAEEKFVTPDRAGRNTQVSKNQSPGDSLRTGASETTIAGTARGDKQIGRAHV